MSNGICTTFSNPGYPLINFLNNLDYYINLIRFYSTSNSFFIYSLCSRLTVRDFVTMNNARFGVTKKPPKWRLNIQIE